MRVSAMRSRTNLPPRLCGPQRLPANRRLLCAPRQCVSGQRGEDNGEHGEKLAARGDSGLFRCARREQHSRMRPKYSSSTRHARRSTALRPHAVALGMHSPCPLSSFPLPPTAQQEAISSHELIYKRSPTLPAGDTIKQCLDTINQGLPSNVHKRLEARPAKRAGELS